MPIPFFDYGKKNRKGGKQFDHKAKKTLRANKPDSVTAPKCSLHHLSGTVVTGGV